MIDSEKQICRIIGRKLNHSRTFVPHHSAFGENLFILDREVSKKAKT